jgi:thiamine-monophosphate kinase
VQGTQSDPPGPLVTSDETLADRGEFGLIDALARRLPQGTEVRVAPGDDAAVVTVDGCPVVVTTDVLVDSVHFRTDWSGPEDIGRRASAASLADLVAMGARPVALVVALTAPSTTESAWVLRLADGLRDEAALVGASVIGGDLSSGPLQVAVTALGRLEGRDPVLRSGAQVGDQVVLSGRVGWAEAGLAVLSRGFRSPRVLVEAYRRPEVPYGVTLEASGVLRSLCDVSDGLLADLGHIAGSSGVGIDVESARLEVGEPIASVAAAYGTDPMTWVLGGGHDHAFVGTVPAELDVPEGFTRIGRVMEAAEPVVTVDGAVWSGPTGHAHFG